MNQKKFSTSKLSSSHKGSKSKPKHVKIVKTTKSTKPKPNTTFKLEGPSTTNMLDEVMDIGETAIGALEGNPMSLLKIPSTIMKVVDVGKNIVKNLTGTKLEQKQIVVDPNTQIKTENEAVVKELSKHMPVISTTAMPSSFVNQFITPPPTVKSTIEKGMKITNIQGSNAFHTFTHPNTTNWTLSGTWPLTPIGSNPIFGTRCNAMANIFQRWRLNSFSIQFIPTQATSQPGNIAIVANNSSNQTSVSTAYIPNLSTLSQMENICVSSASTRADLSVRVKNPWLWCSPDLDATPSLKWYYQWVLGLFVYGNGTGIQTGTLIISFDIDFAQAVVTASSFERVFLGELSNCWVRYSTIDYTRENFFRMLYNVTKTMLEVSPEGMDTFVTTKRTQSDSGMVPLISTNIKTDELKLFYITCIDEEHKEMLNFDIFESIMEAIATRYSSFFAVILDLEDPSYIEIVNRVVKKYLKFVDLKRKKFEVDVDFSDEE